MALLAFILCSCIPSLREILLQFWGLIQSFTMTLFYVASLSVFQLKKILGYLTPMYPNMEVHCVSLYFDYI